MAKYLDLKVDFLFNNLIIKPLFGAYTGLMIIFIAAMMPVLTGFQAAAQEKADSIVALLPRLDGDERLQAIASIAKMSQGAEESRYINMLREEARRLKSIEWEGKALRMLTLSYYHRHDTDSVFTVGEEAIRFMRQHKLYDDLFFLHSEFVKRYVGKDQTLTALRYATDAYAEAKELQDNMAMAYMLSAMGHIYYSVDQYEEAARHYIESIDMAQHSRQKSPAFISNHYRYLAILYAEINRPHETLRYADSLQVEVERLLKDDFRFNSQFLLYHTEYHRAIAYADMKLPEQSFEALRRAEALYDPQWDDDTSTVSVMNDCMYAAYYFSTGNYDKSLEHYAVLLRFYENIDYEAGILHAKKLIAEALAGKGDHRTASEMYRNILEGKEKLNTERFYAQINELRTIYELDKAEQEAAQRLEALRQQRLVIAGLSVACFTLILIALLIVWNRRKIIRKNRGLYRQIREHDRLEQELEAERAKNRELILRFQPDEAEETAKEDPKNYRLFFDRLAILMYERMLFIDPELKRADVASLVGLSDRGLRDCIKQCTGMGFHEYINTLRLNCFRELIANKEENFTIDAAALESGFNSRTTFYRIYNDTYGLTPKQYRAQVRDKKTT